MKLIECPECLGNGEVEDQDTLEWHTCETCDGSGCIEWRNAHNA